MLNVHSASCAPNELEIKYPPIIAASGNKILRDADLITLNAAAIKAVENSIWEPAISNNQKIIVWTEQPVTFKLEGLEE